MNLPFTPLEEPCEAPGWTADHVRERLVGALGVVLRTTKRPGPRRLGNVHPSTIIEFSDLASLSFAETLERWMVDTEARAGRTASAEEFSAAGEAIQWMSRYLAAEPLLADALGTWTICTATGRSIEAVLENRRDKADGRIEALEAQNRVRQAREALGGAVDSPVAQHAIARATDSVVRLRGDFKRITAEKVAWANAKIAEKQAELDARLAALPKKARTAAGQEKLERQRERAIKKAAAYCKRIRRSAGILARREAIATGAVKAKPRALGLTRQDVMPGLIFQSATLRARMGKAAQLIADALNREGVEVG